MEMGNHPPMGQTHRKDQPMRDFTYATLLAFTAVTIYGLALWKLSELIIH